MMIETADAVTDELGDLAVAPIAETLRSAVAPLCLERIASRYPFARDAKREVGLDDFTHFFGPKGVIDQFASEHILPAVDTSGPNWKWREGGGALAKRLGAAALADFQRAAEIRDAFFAADSSKPAFAFSVTPPKLGGAKLEIYGTTVATQGRKPATAAAQWPGSANNQRAALNFHAGRRPPAAIERTGVWSIYRLIDAGRPGADEATTVFSLGGQELDYRFESRPASPGAKLKPLDLTQLRKFRCPHGG
jgi:type VI secretion system protein ImpL